MMEDLALHPATKEQLAVLIKRPTQAVMLVGPSGSGKKTLAKRLAEAILEINDFSEYAYGLRLTPLEGKAIGIESVRELEQFLALKVPTRQAWNRIIIIEDAQQLTTEAQNALLKTLEEPPAGALILLTVSHQQALLPTIRSRVQAVPVTRPGRGSLQAAFAQTDPEQFRQAFAISGGLPGLLHALLKDEEHPLLQATQIARRLLSQTTYERLLKVDELAKQRQLAIDVTFILQQMAHVSLQSATGKAAQKWQTVLAVSYAADEALTHSAQPKLALTHLVLSL